jgi:hypothetical protein
MGGFALDVLMDWSDAYQPTRVTKLQILTLFVAKNVCHLATLRQKTL